MAETVQYSLYFLLKLWKRKFYFSEFSGYCDEDAQHYDGTFSLASSDFTDDGGMDVDTTEIDFDKEMWNNNQIDF